MVLLSAKSTQLTLECIRTGKIGLFYLMFYGVVGAFFAIHLLLFICNVPDPSSPGTRPRNFGGYAYSNYPNSPLSKCIDVV